MFNGGEEEGMRDDIVAAAMVIMIFEVSSGAEILPGE